MPATSPLMLCSLNLPPARSGSRLHSLTCGCVIGMASHASRAACGYTLLPVTLGDHTSSMRNNTLCPVQALYEKQGRSAQFASEAERDQSVRKELKALEKSLQQQTKLASSCRQQVTDQAAACKAAAQVLFVPLP